MTELLSRAALSRNLAYLLAGELLTRAITFVVYATLARQFGPATFGLVEITLAVTMFAMLIGELGYRPLGAREVARDPGQIPALLREIVGAQLWLTCAAVVLVAGAAWLLPLDPRLMWLLIGYSLGLFGLPWMIPWVFQGLNRMELVAGTQVARQAVFAAIVLGAVRGPAQYWLLPFAELVGIAVGAACALIVYRRVRLPAWTVEPRASLWLESLPIGGSQVIWAVRMAVPVVLVGYLHGGAAAGLFGAGQRIMMVFQSLLAQYSNNLFPTLSQAAERGHRELLAPLHRSLRFTVLATSFLAVGVTWFAPQLVGIVFGGKYATADSPAVLSILIWILPVLAWRNHARDGLYAIGRSREDFWSSCVGLVVLAALLWPLVERWGPRGAAAAMLASEVVSAASYWVRFRTHVPLANPVTPLWSGR